MPNARGFTLLELLVSILILGLLTSLAVLSLPDSRAQQIEREAKRLAALLQLAQNEALYGGQDLALTLRESGYFFSRWQQERWSQTHTPNQLAPRELPETIRVTLSLNGETVFFDEPEDRHAESADSVQGDQPSPHIYLLSDGQTSDFTITLRGDQPDSHAARVSGDGSGELRLQRLED